MSNTPPIHDSVFVPIKETSDTTSLQPAPSHVFGDTVTLSNRKIASQPPTLPEPNTPPKRTSTRAPSHDATLLPRLELLLAFSLPPSSRQLVQQARTAFFHTVRTALMTPHAQMLHTYTIACCARWEASSGSLVPHEIQRLLIQTQQPLPSDLPIHIPQRQLGRLELSNIQGPIYPLEYLAQRTGQSPADILAALPSDFWNTHFNLHCLGEQNDAICNFIEQLPHYIPTPMAFLQSCAPGAQEARLASIISGIFDRISSSKYEPICRKGAVNILSALFHLASEDAAATHAIASTFISCIEDHPALLAEYSECFALLVEHIQDHELIQRASKCITPSIACRDPILRETIFRMTQSGVRFDKEVLASAALGPAHITTQNPSETWALWRTALIQSRPQHRLITEQELSHIEKPTFIAVAEVFTRAIDLAHAIGFHLKPNHQGILDSETVAFVAAVMSPREGNFRDFAQQLHQADISIKPDLHVYSFAHFLSEVIVVPASSAYAPSTQNIQPRLCALALAEGRTVLTHPAKKPNQGYNLLTFGRAALRFERHYHGIAQAITTIPTHNQFHPILAPRGEIPVSMWTDPSTGIRFQEIDTDDFRLREAKILGHCGGATPYDRTQRHWAQYAVHKDDQSIATFDVSLENAKGISIPEYIQHGAGNACQIHFAHHILHVIDIGGAGDTKRIPAEVTAAWERFAQLLQAEAVIPENRLGDKPPSLTPLSADPVLATCGYDYQDASERLRIFNMVCKHEALKGASELVLFRTMFKDAQTPEQWVFGAPKL